MSGLGTSSNTAGTTTQTQPWAPAQSILQNELTNANSLTSAGAPNPASNSLWSGAQQATEDLNSNPGTTAANLGQSFVNGVAAPGGAVGAPGSVGGDPTGELAAALKSYQSTMNPIAQMNANPTSNPATQQLMQAIQDQTQQSINGQFAGAGRSMSGYNTKDLAMGLSEGEAPTLFNQYNQNLSNIQNASQGLLGAGQSTQALQNANQQAGLQMLSSAYPLSQLPAQTLQSAMNQPAINQAQMAGLGENLSIPIAGLGGQTQGTGAGTATASPLSQIASAVPSASSALLTAGLFGALV